MTSTVDLRKGVAIMAAGALCAVGVGAGVKHASPETGTATATFLRFALALIVLAPLWAWRFRDIARCRRTGTHVARGAVAAVAVGLYFWTVDVMPLANAITLQFTAPLLTPPLASVMLGERTGAVGYAGVAVAVVGAALTAAPDIDAFGPAAAVGLASAALGAILAVHAKVMTNAGESLVVMAFHFTWVGAAAWGIWVLASDAWSQPTPTGWAALAVAGAFGTGAQVFVFGAYKHLPSALFAALKLAPLPLSIAVGYAAFGEIPAFAALVGVALVAAGCLATSLDRRRRR